MVVADDPSLGFTVSTAVELVETTWMPSTVEKYEEKSTTSPLVGYDESYARVKNLHPIPGAMPNGPPPVTAVNVAAISLPPYYAFNAFSVVVRLPIMLDCSKAAIASASESFIPIPDA